MNEIKSVCILQGRPIGMLNIMECDSAGIDEIVVIGKAGTDLIRSVGRLCRADPATDEISGELERKIDHINHIVIAKEIRHTGGVELNRTCLGREWSFHETDYRLPANSIVIDIPYLTPAPVPVSAKKE